MKKVLLSVIFFAFAANVSAQLKVDATGNTRASGNIYLSGTSNFLGTSSNVPILFKVNGVSAGNTGASTYLNVSFGYQTLFSNTTSYCNTAIGNQALYSNTTGYGNTATGFYALHSNTTGGNNIAIGNQALYSNTTGGSNIAAGPHALLSNTTGAGNIAIGGQTLYYNTTGIYNIAIGYSASHNADNLSNTTAIGYNAIVNSSNQVRIGNSSVTSIGGYAGWTNFSDGRAKKNIHTDVPGLAFVNLLQPVTYNLDLDAVDGLLKIDRAKISGRDEVEQPMSQELIDIEKKGREAKEKQVQTGFVAQDVEKVAQSIGYDFSGVDVDETGIYGLRYAEFVVPLVKAVQELSEQNDRLQAQINELTELVSTLQGKEADPRSATTAESVLTK
jgi:hypothetical protein